MLCRSPEGRLKIQQKTRLGGWLVAFGDAEMDLSAAGFDGKDRELFVFAGKEQ